jgi:hypothetical protein
MDRNKRFTVAAVKLVFVLYMGVPIALASYG